MPAADEVGRLQRGEDADSKLFQKLAEQGHYAGRTVPSTTRQGIYAAAPSGLLLASINTREPRDVADMLVRALARWEELGDDERLLPEFPGLPGAELKHWEARYPGDGLVLRVIARDVEREVLPKGWRASAWNQDFAWFTPAEVLALVPEAASVAAERAWPSEVVNRLARCHLVDDVRGQVPAFRPEDVEHAELTSTVTGVDGELVALELHGATRAAAKGRWPVQDFHDEANPSEQTRGFEAELVGKAVFDRASRRFVSFELVAVGTRWGGTKFNGRGDDLEPAPMGISLTLAADRPEECVAPALIWDYGWSPP